MSDSRMEHKIDIIQADITEIKTTLAVNTESLKQHMLRTELLERRVESFWSRALVAVSILGGLITLVDKLIGS